MNKSILEVGRDFGLYLASAYILFGVLIYFFTDQLLNSDSLVVLGLLGLGMLMYSGVVMVLFAIFAVKSFRKVNGGFNTFKDGFSVSVITIFIGLLVYTLFNILLYRFIDADFGDRTKEQTIEMTVKFLERANVPPSQIEENIQTMQEQDNYSIGSIIINSTVFLSIGLLISLIVAAAMKKEKFEFEA